MGGIKVTYQEALAWIHGRLKFGSRPGLDRINALLERLDNPQNKIKTIHIAGTNGKGSTVTYLRTLFQEQGLVVGTYTSPFIERFNERISINGQQIPDEDLVKLVEKFQGLTAELDQIEDLNGITEFEVVTAMMFDYFEEQQVDLAIIEVGLGGTLDCTNVITPLASAITTIGYDHMDILGDTLAEIARQKAGIIKKNRPVVIGKVPDEALAEIVAKALLEESPIYRLNQEYQVTYEKPLKTWGEQFTFENSDRVLHQLKIPLIGQHQTENASVALELFLIVAPIFGIKATDKEIQSALNLAVWPGRMEKISDEPLIILDGAHNEPAIEVLVDNIKKEFKNREIYTLFSALSTKDIRKMLGLLKEIPRQHLHLTIFDSPKSETLDNYLEIAPDVPRFTSWQSALAEITQEMSSEDVLLITGSLYFISEVRNELLGGVQ